MDAFHIERKSLSSIIQKATKGGRKRRTTSSSLVHQVVYPHVDQIYELVAKYDYGQSEISLEDFVKSNLDYTFEEESN